MRSTSALAGSVAVAAVLSCGAAIIAHQTVVSPFTYHRDVRPILQQRCGHCHTDGGVAPISLLRYQDAQRQSWPIRQALISGRMPPWFAESGAAAIKEPQALTARELHVLLTWAAGGAPAGIESAVPAAAPDPAWALGQPDLVLAMPAPFTLAAGTAAADYEVVLPAARVRGKWIRAVDLLPGTPAIVRRATIVLKTAAREQTIGLWIPGDTPQLFEHNGAFRVPGDASLVLRVHYQQPRPEETAAAVIDRSQLGIYFAAPLAAQAISGIDVTEMSRPIDRAVEAIAVRPVSGPTNATVRLTVVTNDGSRAPLLSLRHQPEWPRRYVFAQPVALLAGSRIEATVVPYSNLLWQSLTKEAAAGLDNGGNFHAILEVTAKK